MPELPSAGETVNVPPLDEGDYEVLLTLTAASGQRREITRAFTRKRFVWEKETLGMDRVVIPPFLPMTVDKRHARVTCVLRTHELAEDGLWKQVASQGVSGLKAMLTGVGSE